MNKHIYDIETIFDKKTGYVSYEFAYDQVYFQLNAEPVHSSNKSNKVVFTLCDVTGRNITTLSGEKLVIYSLETVTAPDFWQRLSFSLRLIEKINHLRIDAQELKDKLLNLKTSQATSFLQDLFRFIALANDIRDAVLTSLTGLTQNQIKSLNDWKKYIAKIKSTYAKVSQ